MTDFEFDPGLTVEVLVTVVDPYPKPKRASHTLTLGDMVRVTDGVFKNFVGHIWRLQAETGKATIRQGTPEDWHRR